MSRPRDLEWPRHARSVQYKSASSPCRSLHKATNTELRNQQHCVISVAENDILTNLFILEAVIAVGKRFGAELLLIDDFAFLLVFFVLLGPCFGLVLLLLFTGVLEPSALLLDALAMQLNHLLLVTFDLLLQRRLIQLLLLRLSYFEPFEHINKCIIRACRRTF